MITGVIAAALASLAVWLATPEPRALRRLAALRAISTMTTGTQTTGTQTTGRGSGARLPDRVTDGPRLSRRHPVNREAWGNLLGRVRGWRRRRAVGAAWEEASVELCQSMAAELRAGRTPGDALRASVDVLPSDVRTGLRAVVAVASAGGDVPAELSAVARDESGAAGLRQVAAAWRVGAGSGGGLADVLERVAQSLRDEHAHRAQVEAQLAGPKATARLLAALPLLGIALAAASGTNPLDFLFGTPTGLACLATGLSLDALGLWWTSRITTTALTTTK